MGNFFAELKRRHIYRVAAAYAVVAWVVLQIVNNIAPGLNLPNSAVTLVIVLLAAGFPIALIFAWILHLASGEAASAKSKHGAVDWILAGALVVVIGIFVYQQVVQAPGARTTEKVAVATAASPASPAQSGGISIAVLPFANLSGDTAQEFFSDGMTEEIMTALTKVSALRVVGRESAFQFKDRKTEMRAVGQALGAAYLVEGSVRKAGDQVRITAQLVQADNGVSLWTESYDRELKNIFATQTDIAQAIAGALRVPLGLKQGDTLVSNRTNDVNSYQQYLRAKALVRARSLAGLTDATALLEQVVAREPNYAPAWGLLAVAYAILPQYFVGGRAANVDETRRVVDASLPKAEAAARRAIELDPNGADGYLSLGLAQETRGKILLGEDLYSKALALDPNNPDALHFYSGLLAGAGRLKEALAMRQQLEVLEPFVPIFVQNTALIMWVNGQGDAALVLMNSLPSSVGRPVLARMYAAAGRFNEAADAVLQIPSGVYVSGTVEAVARVLRNAPTAGVIPQTLPPRLGNLGFVYLYIGAPVRALEFYEDEADTGYATINSPLWHPSFAALRKTERFKALVGKLGLVEYWRERGWAEFCRPIGADDFVCD